VTIMPDVIGIRGGGGISRTCKKCPHEAEVPEDVDVRLAVRIYCELAEAEEKAWDFLSRYKFLMFGYWVGVWVNLNRIGPQRPNPFGELVTLAKIKKLARKEGIYRRIGGKPCPPK
jgi:hypothetical protein